jgi:hypothetical protein
MARYSDQQNPPDAPLKVGRSGMYRLAIKEVFPNGKNFRYHLVDADGNRYTAVSKKSFRKNQLVRCIVQFTFINFERRVTQVCICKKQDINDTPPKPGWKMSPAERIVSRATVNPGIIPTEYPFREGSPKKVNKTGSYRFTIDLSMPCPGGTPCKYIYLMLDCYNQKYHAVSNIKYEKGDKLVCRVEVLKEGENRKFFLTISDDETSQAVCLVDRRIVARKNYTPHYPKAPVVSQTKPEQKKKDEDEPERAVEQTEPVFNRRAAEIFDSLKESGFHKCGKAFVCSCCGKQYYLNQGIKSDTKELYLCNTCRGRMRKRERKSNSVYAIFTPMGNKR